MSSNNPWWLFFIIVLVLVGVISVISIRWYYRRSAELLKSWAQKNNYQIVEQEHRSLARGPYFWTASKYQAVFRVKVQDSEGYIRNGWVRAGNWWSGVRSDQIEVRWDDESS